MVRLVSLCWQTPVPSVVIAQTLRPDHVTLVGGQDRQAVVDDAARLLRRNGLDVTTTMVRSGTDPSGPSSMRSVLEPLLRDPDVLLDYTAGTKLLSVMARCLLHGQDADNRAVYLRGGDGHLGWDDGRVQTARVDLTVEQLAALHGTHVTGRQSLDGRERVVEECVQGARWVARRCTEGRRVDSYLASEVALSMAVARGEASRKRGRRDEQANRFERDDAEREVRRTVNDVSRGHGWIVPAGTDSEGGWLELVVADAAKRTIGRAGHVMLNLRGRRSAVGVTPLVEPGDFSKSIRDAVHRLRGVTDGLVADGFEDDILDVLSGPRIDEGRLDEDLEVDVAILRGHRLYVISCYAGANPAQAAWKAKEIWRRGAQLAGDTTRAAFAYLGTEDAAKNLARAVDGGVDGGITVFSARHLQDWLRGDLDSLATFLDLRPRSQVPPASTGAVGSAHDLVITAGTTPVPIVQSILTHGARRPLLVHSTGATAAVRRACAVLAGKGVDAATLDVGEGDDAREILRHLGRLDHIPRLDITGGTKVIASRAVLAHAGTRTSVTYVRGDTDALTHLWQAQADVPVTAQLGVEDFLQLGGFKPTKGTRVVGNGASAYPTGSPARDNDRQAAAALADWVAQGLRHASPELEVWRDVEVRPANGGGRIRCDLLASDGVRLAAMSVTWATRRRVVREAAWDSQWAARRLAGHYGRTAVVAPIDAETVNGLRRGLRPLGPPKTAPVVFGERDLAAARRKDFDAFLRRLMA